jgi:hypothetical protein
MIIQLRKDFKIYIYIYLGRLGFLDRDRDLTVWIVTETRLLVTITIIYFTVAHLLYFLKNKPMLITC